jgi:hypothetical protein
MIKKWWKLTVIPLFIIIFIASSGIVRAKESVQWKTEKTQWIKANSWQTLDFDGKTSITKMSKSRALYCTQVGLNFPKKNPSYIKVRFTRELPNGKLDTTATNTWVLNKQGPKTWHGSICWAISTEYPVKVQIKIKGKGSYKSHLRQFKAWSPSSDLPETAPQ